MKKLKVDKQNNIIRKIDFLIFEVKGTNVSEKSRAKSNSMVMTTVDLQNIKGYTNSRKTVAYFKNNENEKFKELLNNVDEQFILSQALKNQTENENSNFRFNF